VVIATVLQAAPILLLSEAAVAHDGVQTWRDRRIAVVTVRVKDGGVLLSVHCDTSDQITRAKEAEGQNFYVDRLGFRISDRSADFGDFLRAAGALDHHTLGLFNFRDKAGFGHIAFEVSSFDEVMLGGQYMKRQGWKPQNKPGRHIVGSNTYWNFNSPCGGNTEYFSDMDLMDDNWQPRIWVGRNVTICGKT